MAKAGFDPAAVRDTLFSDVGFEWQLGRSFEESQVCGALASGANFDLTTAIDCILVGLDEPATRLLEKAHSWATAGLSSDKEIPGWLTFETLVLCEWLLHDRHNHQLYHKLTDARYRLATTPKVGGDAVSVSLALPSFVDAGDYERVLELFERTRKLVEPAQLNKIRNEAQMCLVIAKHRLGMGFTEGEVFSACDKFMTKSMDKWLRDGHSIRAAEWMKIIWGNRAGNHLSPNETLLKCYDYLPGCRRPF